MHNLHNPIFVVVFEFEFARCESKQKTTKIERNRTMKMTGLLMAFLASVGATCITNVNAKDINGDHCRMIHKYMSPELQELVDEALSKAKEGKKDHMLTISGIDLKDHEHDLKVLSMVYSKYNAYKYTVEITQQQISVVVPQVVIPPIRQRELV